MAYLVSALMSLAFIVVPMHGLIWGIRNIKQYLLATLYNAPVTVDSYYSAQVRHEFEWGSRVDKN